MLALGCDHGGVELKDFLKVRLESAGYEVHDFGCFTKDHIDYPDKAREVCRAIADGDCEKGVLICGTGIGMSMSANKMAGIRAALCADTYSARMAAEHNDANIITLGARTLGGELAWEILQTWLGSSFQGGIHRARVEKIDALI